jgi:uncharacterized membrane protein (UPF0127 family)
MKGIIASTGTLLIYRLIYMPDGVVAADKIEYANSLWQKGIGLLGRRKLKAGQGMWLPSVSSIHTFGMQISIDVLFLDKNYRTTRACSRVGPLHVCLSPKGTKHCIELAAGTLTEEQCRSLLALWNIEPAI